jgi:ribosomal RNA-processing protein 9
VECCKYVTGTEWVSGGNDGSLQLWSQTKKRPIHVVRGAHGSGPAGGAWAAGRCVAAPAAAALALRLLLLRCKAMRRWF